MINAANLCVQVHILEIEVKSTWGTIPLANFQIEQISIDMMCFFPGEFII